MLISCDYDVKVNQIPDKNRASFVVDYAVADKARRAAQEEDKRATQGNEAAENGKTGELGEEDHEDEEEAKKVALNGGP